MYTLFAVINVFSVSAFIRKINTGHYLPIRETKQKRKKTTREDTYILHFIRLPHTSILFHESIVLVEKIPGTYILHDSARDRVFSVG